MNKSFIALAAILASSVSVAQDNCVQQRYQVTGTELLPGDEVTLVVGQNTVSFVIDSSNNLAKQWPQVLGWKLRNNVAAEVASMGNLNDLNNLGRYIPKLSATENYLDVAGNDAVSLTINGQEIPGALSLVTQATEQEKEIDLPLWRAGSGDNAFVFLTNLTNEPMPVMLELISENGGTFVSSGGYSSGFAGNPTQTGGTTLAANSSAYYHISSSSVAFGTGKIRWTPGTCEKSLMVAINQTLSHQTDIFRLNGGEAF